ncbi:hypothetical protein F5B20DRAFT_575976 [Whalleya microplaca]|nr:hypothetical protein F5B20DRAFT_575976 [Whalleya microplaca]
MSLGPLTTSFTPPADCLASTALYWVNTASTFYWLHGKPYQSSCFPANYSPYQSQYYRPGVCPGGYTQACGSLTGSGASIMSRAVCCPEGNYVCASESNSYDYVWGSTLRCNSVINTQLQTCFTSIDGTLAGTETSCEEMTVTPSQTIMAYGIIVENAVTTTTDGASTDAWTGRPPWATGESWGRPPWFTAVSTSTTSSATSSIAETAASTPTTSPLPNSSGLSPGAAAGIGVAGGIGVLALASAIAYMLFSRRRKKLAAQSASNTQGDESAVYEVTKAWVPSHTPVQVNWPPSELAASREPGELTAEREPVEKDGTNLSYP